MGQKVNPVGLRVGVNRGWESNWFANKKDFATKRGLLMMVGKRKRLLSYLKDRNLDGYRNLIKELGIRG